MPEFGEVNRLLDASRAAHAEYRRAANTLPPNYTLAEQHVARALDLRMQAHVLDPEHHASGWKDDKVPHATLVNFYKRYPTIE